MVYSRPTELQWAARKVQESRIENASDFGPGAGLRQESGRAGQEELRWKRGRRVFSFFLPTLYRYIYILPFSYPMCVCVCYESARCVTHYVYLLEPTGGRLDFVSPSHFFSSACTLSSISFHGVC